MTNIPTISQLYADIKADLETSLDFTFPLFGKLFIAAVASVQAAKLKLFYLALANLQKNVAPDTAESESTGGTLERFGRIKLNRNPYEATQGKYDATVTGISGSLIKAQTTFKSDDGSSSPSKLFILDYDYTLSSISGTITLRALESGVESKLIPGDTLSATAPIVGVNKTATVTVEVVQPLAGETLEEYRAKVIDAYRIEPQGGAANDYRLWSSDVQGVKQVYPYAKTGFANEIDLFVEANIADSTDGKGTPSTLMLDAVKDVVEFDPDTTRPLTERGRRPLGVFEIHFLPVVIHDIEIEIAGFVGLTPTIETELTTALTALISKIRPFISAADILESKNDILDTNRVIAAILAAKPGSVFGTITIKVDGTPTPSYVLTNGSIPYLDSVTFI